jgi:hypothetical protein
MRKKIAVGVANVGEEGLWWTISCRLVDQFFSFAAGLESGGTPSQNCIPGDTIGNSNVLHWHTMSSLLRWCGRVQAL